MADWLQDVRTLARTLVVKLQHLLAVRPVLRLPYKRLLVKEFRHSNNITHKPQSVTFFN